jgi:hypothetical protein
VKRIYEQLVYTNIKSTGRPDLKVYPHKDESVRRIARKVVRRLIHSLDWKTVIPDDWVKVEKLLPLPSEHEGLLQPVYVVPNAFDSRASIFAEDDPDNIDGAFHSWWQLRFYEVPLTCFVIKPMT